MKIVEGWTLHRAFNPLYLPDFESVVHEVDPAEFVDDDIDALIDEARSRGWGLWQHGCFAFVLKHPEIEGVLLKVYQAEHHRKLYGMDDYTSEEHRIIETLDDERVMQVYGHHRYGMLVEEINGLSLAALTDTDEEIVPYLAEVVDFIQTAVSKGVVPFDLHAANLFVEDGKVRFIDVGCYQFLDHFVNMYNGEFDPVQTAIHGAIERLIMDETTRESLNAQYAEGSPDTAWQEVDPMVPARLVPYFDQLRTRGVFLEHIDWEDVVRILIEFVEELGWKELDGGSYAIVFEHPACPEVLLKIYNEDHHYDLYDGEYPTVEEHLVAKRISDDPRCMKVLGHHKYGVFVSRIDGSPMHLIKDRSPYVEQLDEYIRFCISRKVVPLDLNTTNVHVADGQLRFIDFGHYQLLEDFIYGYDGDEDPYEFALEKMSEDLGLHRLHEVC